MLTKSQLKKYPLAFILISCLILIAFFTNSKDDESLHLVDERFNMNTLMQIDVWCNKNNSKEVKISIDKAFATIQDVNKQTDRYSELTKYGLYNLNKLNTAQLPVEYEKSTHLVHLLHFLATHKSPYFKANLANLIDLWKEKKAANTVPTKKEVTTALINSKNTLDLGGIAKGYAIDKAYEDLLKNKHIQAALINCGGNIRVLGLRKNKKSWKIAIQHPRIENNYLGIITLKPGESVATSGDYQRYYEVNKKRYHHILNPQTGYPARGLISVTVWAKTAELADYYSTLLFVADLDEAKNILKQKPAIGAIIMTFDQKLYVSPNLEKIFKREN